MCRHFKLAGAAVTNGLPGAGTFSGPGVSSSGMFDPSAAGDGNKTIRYSYAAKMAVQIMLNKQ